MTFPQYVISSLLLRIMDVLIKSITWPSSTILGSTIALSTRPSVVIRILLFQQNWLKTMFFLILSRCLPYNMYNADETALLYNNKSHQIYVIKYKIQTNYLVVDWYTSKNAWMAGEIKTMTKFHDNIIIVIVMYCLVVIVHNLINVDSICLIYW